MKDPNKLSREGWIDYVDSQKGPTEKWQDTWTKIARDRVHNLDLSISEHRDIYDSTLRTHIMFGEVHWKFISTNSEDFDFNIPRFVQVKHYSGKIIRKHISDLLEIPGFCIK